MYRTLFTFCNMLKVDPSVLALTKSFMKASQYDLLTYEQENSLSIGASSEIYVNFISYCMTFKWSDHFFC